MFQEHDPRSGMSAVEIIPVILMESFLGKGHMLFTENYYTSPSKQIFLLENQTHLCGTIRTNR